MKSRFIHILFLTLAMTSCDKTSKTPFTDAERELINESGFLMRVLTVDEPEDVEVLRRECTYMTDKDIQSPDFARLAVRMIATVTSPEQDGVGIAGPQVGINRRVVAVQRLDKEGEPFQVYPNIRITAVRGEKVAGEEGCLSVPGRRGSVDRYQEIDITYTQAVFRKNRLTKDVVAAGVKDTTETVKGFTAVIFQHECDHLDGVLYIDKLND